MSIQRFFTKTFTVKRQVWTSNKSSISTIGTFKGHIQQTKVELVKELGLSYANSYTLYCPHTTNILKEDIVEYGTDVYSVRQIAIKDYGTVTNKHLQIILEKKK